MAQENLKYKTKIGLYWKFFEQFSNYGMQFLVGIFMARMLTPTDYGITALPAVFMAIAALFIDSGFANALVRKQDLTEKDLSTSFFYSLAVGVICYIIIYVSSPWIAAFYNTPILEKLMRITALTFLLSPLSTPQSVILQRKLDFRTPAKISVATRIVGATIGITMAYNGYGLWALVISSLSSTLFSLIITWCVVRWIPKERWSTDSFRYLFGYGSKLLLTYLIDKVYSNITPVIIGKFYSPAQLGVYNRALSYAQLPSNHLTGIIGGITFPVLCKVQNDTDLLASTYRRILRATAFIVFPLMTMLCILAHPLIILMITEKWTECIPYLQIMCLWWVWIPIHSLNLNLLLVKGKSGVFLRLEIIKKIVGLSIMCITLPMGIIPFLIGSVISSLIALFINTYYTGKYINVGFLTQMMDIMPIIILCVTTGGFTYLLCSQMESLWLQLVTGGFLANILYLGISYTLKFPELYDLKYMLSQKK